MSVIGEEYSLACILLLFNYLILFTCVLTSFDICVHQNSEMLTSEFSHSYVKFRTYSSSMWGVGCLHGCGSRRTVPNGVVNCTTKLKYRNVTPAKCTKGLPDGVYSNGNEIYL